MSLGTSGTYAIEETELTLKPTTAKWDDRDILGMDGGGHPVYPSIRQFEMSWQLISPGELSQLITFYNSVKNTGTVSVDLPEWGANEYRFARYSGCTLSEPMVGEFFEGTIQQVRLLIYGIST